MLHPKKCLNCDTAIVGRQGKKFCSDQCRASFNNRNKAHHELLIKDVNTRLRRNRTILKSLCPIGKATVRRETLAEMGFAFAAFTTIFPTKTGLYFFCYDYGYRPVVEHQENIQKVLIVQSQSYMEKGFDPWQSIKWQSIQ